MKIIYSNLKSGLVNLKVEDIEDLWYLSHLIDPGDFVKGKTTRKMKIGDSENAKTTKRTLTLKVEAESIDFSEDGSSLRINGKIKEGPDDLPKESYHAISLEEGTEFTLEKPRWLEYQKQKLQEATEDKYNYLMCLFDREEALFALTKKNGYLILLKIKGDVPKKSKQTEIKKDFQEEIIKALDVYAMRNNPEAVILASPAFYKEDLYKKINDKELKKKIVLASCFEISENALDEVLKSPDLSKVLQSSRARKENLLVEQLLAEINKDALAAYGKKEVQKAADAGAISQLLLTDKFIKKEREEKRYDNLDRMMKNLDALRSEIHIISSENQEGKKLDGLGGIAAILRYRI